MFGSQGLKISYFGPKIMKNHPFWCLYPPPKCRILDPFRTVQWVHGNRVGFQNGSNPHIYRAQGKSELRNVFLLIPYPWDQKLVAWMGHPRQKILDFRRMSPLRVENHRFSVILPDFRTFWSKNPGKSPLGRPGPLKIAILGHFMPF